MNENKHLKWLLIIQSFLPLFILLTIKYIKKSTLSLIFNFFRLLTHGNFKAITKAWYHPEFCLTILIFLCLVMVMVGFIIYIFFRKTQSSGFIDRAEKITVDEDTTENSVAYFVTYVIPMVMDDISEWRGFSCFLIILLMLILLMRNTNLYYQNPILAILGYKTFYFQFSETSEENLKGKNFIAITRGVFDKTKIIKRKHIADNVYLIYNKN